LSKSKLKVLDLFSGIGGFSLALESTGHFQTIGFVENDEYCQAVLQHHFPEVPILGDIKNVTKETVPTRPDVICGGFPCQPFSVAGDQRAKDDPRHLWPEMLRIIKEQKPTWVVGENVSGLVKLGLDEILDEMEDQGYSTRTFNIPAFSVGAPHQRQRLWIIGHLGDPEHNGSPTPERERGLLKQSEEPKKQISIWESEGTSSASGDVANPDNERVRSRIGGDDFNYEEESGEGGVDGEGSAGDDEWYDTSPTQDEGVDVANPDVIGSSSEQFRDIRGLAKKSREEKGRRSKSSVRIETRSSDVANPESFKSREQTERQGRENTARRSDDSRGTKTERTETVTDPNGKGLQGQRKKYKLPKSKRKREIGGSSWWDIEPNVGRVAYGVPNRVFKLRALGNSIVPQIAQKIGYAIIEAEKNGHKEGSKF
jgi:DNA (cytosine-5)-methyltransferase 1